MLSGQMLAGLGLAAAAATCFDGAVLLQAAEARTVEHAEALRPSLVARLARRRRWLLGTAIAVAGWPLQVGALALAPVTLVQPTLALGLVLLLAVGRRMLGEHVGTGQRWAAGAVVVGVVGLALTAPNHTTRAVNETAALFISLGLLAVVMATIGLPGRETRRGWALIIGAGCAFALTAVASKMLTVALALGHPAAAFGWAVVVVVAGGSGFLVDMSALQRFPATRVAPAMFVLETVIPVSCAPIAFGERWGATPGGGIWLVASLLLLLIGGAALGARRSAAGNVEHEVGCGGKAPVADVRVGG